MIEVMNSTLGPMNSTDSTTIARAEKNVAMIKSYVCGEMLSSRAWIGAGVYFRRRVSRKPGGELELEVAGGESMSRHRFRCLDLEDRRGRFIVGVVFSV